MLKIGDFSKLSRVSIRMLRYYDEIGLLKPVETDRFTDYRATTAKPSSPPSAASRRCAIWGFVLPTSAPFSPSTTIRSG